MGEHGYQVVGIFGRGLGGGFCLGVVATDQPFERPVSDPFIGLGITKVADGELGGGVIAAAILASGARAPPNVDLIPASTILCWIPERPTMPRQVQSCRALWC